MINRLPAEFRLQNGNGRKTSRDNGAEGSTIVNLLSRRSTQCIIDHPVAALGAALVTGLLLARLVKR